MRTTLTVAMCVLSGLLVCSRAHADEPKYPKAECVPACTDAPACGKACTGTSGPHWTQCCFPRSNCPDDYCANLLPRQCWLPYPSFYKCVPAGACARPDGCSKEKDRRSWWFVPTPQGLHDAIWAHP